jgi:hypothetical protein
VAWETRQGKGRYYTRSRRINGRVVREYCGTGLSGQLAALQDAEKRARKATQLRAWQTEQGRLEELEEPLEELDGVCDLLMKATLIGAGYHRHKRGEWRRRRG